MTRAEYLHCSIGTHLIRSYDKSHVITMMFCEWILKWAHQPGGSITLNHKDGLIYHKRTKSNGKTYYSFDHYRVLNEEKSISQTSKDKTCQHKFIPFFNTISCKFCGIDKDKA
jgi:hypothetical protein